MKSSVGLASVEIPKFLTKPTLYPLNFLITGGIKNSRSPSGRESDREQEEMDFDVVMLDLFRVGKCDQICSSEQKPSPPSGWVA